MANMSYCRFENTLADLKDCADNIYKECSDLEHGKRKALIKLCHQIAQDFEYDEELDIEEIDELPHT